MIFFRRFLVLVFLSLFLFCGTYIDSPKAFADQVEATQEEAEDELSDISFEKIIQARFDNIPNVVHEAVHDHFLTNGFDKEFSYAYIENGKSKGNYVVSVTPAAENFKGFHLESFVVTPEGQMKRIADESLIKKVKAFSPEDRHSFEKLKSRSGLNNSNNGIRERYNRSLVNIAREVEVVGLEKVTEDFAQIIHEKRRAIGKELKRESGFFQEAVIKGRNWWKYGDTLGPTYGYLAKRGISPSEIAVKAVSSGGGDMGLKSNADNPVIRKLHRQLEAMKQSKQAVKYAQQKAHNDNYKRVKSKNFSNIFTRHKTKVRRGVSSIEKDVDEDLNKKAS